MKELSRLETALGGIAIALAAAMPDRIEHIVAGLEGLINDSRTGDYERQLYRDLVDSLAVLTSPPPIDESDFRVTVH